MRRLIVLLVVLIGYGSFFPFAYVPHSPSFDDFGVLLSWPARLGLGDALGNIVLFLPLGLVIGVRGGAGASTWFAFFAAAVYAAIIQYIQFWFPSRVPSGSDIVFNMVGCAVGIFAGVLAHAALSQGETTARGSNHAKVWAPMILALFWVAYRWFPLVPTLDVQNVKDALKPLFRDRTWTATNVAHDAVAWLMWFRLCRYAFEGRVSAWVFVASAWAIVGLEPLFYRNTISINNIAGLGLASVFAPLFMRGKASLGWLVIVAGLSILVWAALPLNFDAFPREMSWMPLSGFLTGSLLTNTASLFEKVFLYAAWVYLALYLGMKPFPIGALAVGGLFLAEFLQKWTLTKSPEVTDPLLALIIVAILSPSVSKNLTLQKKRRPQKPEKSFT